MNNEEFDSDLNIQQKEIKNNLLKERLLREAGILDRGSNVEDPIMIDEEDVSTQDLINNDDNTITSKIIDEKLEYTQ